LSKYPEFYQCMACNSEARARSALEEADRFEKRMLDCRADAVAYQKAAVKYRASQASRKGSKSKSPA
jgi:hypothetical protein